MRSDCPSLIREYPPFWGRSISAYLRNSYGKASMVGGNRAGWLPESRKLDPGITGSGGITSSGYLAGAEDITGAVENRSGLL